MDRPESVLRRIEQNSESVFLPIVGREKGALLESLVRKTRPLSILEVGTLVGYSAILMARNMEAGKITTIEIDTESAMIAERNINDAGFGKAIDILEGDASQVIPKLKGQFDLVFIDAAKSEYLAYLGLLEAGSKLKPGAIIVADNAKIFAKQMKDYLHHVKTSGKYESRLYDFGADGMEVSIKK